MFGNIVNNSQLKYLIEKKHLYIEPFNVGLLDSIHYPLHPKSVLHIMGRNRDGNSSLKIVKTVGFNTSGIDDDVYEFQPKETVLIQVNELVKFEDGIVAQFCSPFSLVDKGFSLNSGRMSSKFGGKGERLIFGLTNLLDDKNSYSLVDPLAYIYFVDLRGLNNLSTDEFKSKKERELFELFIKRLDRARDDGPYYEHE